MSIKYKLLISFIYLIVGFFSWFIVLVLINGFFEKPTINDQALGFAIIYLYFSSYFFFMSQKTKEFYKRFKGVSGVYLVLVSTLLISNFIENKELQHIKENHLDKPQILRDVNKIDFGSHRYNISWSAIEGEVLELSFANVRSPDFIIKLLPELPPELQYYKLESAKVSYFYNKEKQFVTCYGETSDCMERLGYTQADDTLLTIRNSVYENAYLVEPYQDDYVKKYDWHAMFEKKDITKEKITFPGNGLGFYSPSVYIKLNQFEKQNDLDMMRLRHHLGAEEVVLIESEGRHYVYYNSSSALDHTPYVFVLAEAEYKNGEYVIKKDPADHSLFAQKQINDDFYLTVFYDKVFSVSHAYHSEKPELQYEILDVSRNASGFVITIENPRSYKDKDIIEDFFAELEPYLLKESTYQIIVKNQNETVTKLRLK